MLNKTASARANPYYVRARGLGNALNAFGLFARVKHRFFFDKAIAMRMLERRDSNTESGAHAHLDRLAGTRDALATRLL